MSQMFITNSLFLLKIDSQFRDFGVKPRTPLVDLKSKIWQSSPVGNARQTGENLSKVLQPNKNIKEKHLNGNFKI